MKPLHLAVALVAVALGAVGLRSTGVIGAPSVSSPSRAASEKTPPKRPTKPLAVVEGVEDDATAALLDLRRSGPKIVTATLRITRRPGDAPLAWRPGLEGQDGEYGTAAGLRLIDEDNGREHFPLMDSSGRCVCTSGVNGLWPGESLNVSAKFPAPPAGVQRMSLQVPEFQSFDSIPLGG